MAVQENGKKIFDRTGRSYFLYKSTPLGFGEAVRVNSWLVLQITGISLLLPATWIPNLSWPPPWKILPTGLLTSFFRVKFPQSIFVMWVVGSCSSETLMFFVWKFCGNAPKCIENGRKHPYCSRTCARKAGGSTSSSSSPPARLRRGSAAGKHNFAIFRPEVHARFVDLTAIGARFTSFQRGRSPRSCGTAIKGVEAGGEVFQESWVLIMGGHWMVLPLFTLFLCSASTILQQMGPPRGTDIAIFGEGVRNIAIAWCSVLWALHARLSLQFYKLLTN